MAALLDLLHEVLDDDRLDALGKRFGLGPNLTRNAVGLGLPALLGGLAHHASQPDGADELLTRVHGAGGDPDSAAGGTPALSQEQQDDDAGFVHRLLGGGAGGGGVLGSLASRLGVSRTVVGGVLGGLLPLVLGALGKLGGAGGLTHARLSGLLADATADAADAAPGGRPAIASLLGPLGAVGLGVGGGVAAATPGAAEAAPAAAAAVEAQPTPVREKDRFAGGGLWWLLGAGVLAAALIAVFASGSFDNDGSSTPSASTTTTTTATTSPTATTPTTTTPSATPSGGSSPAIARINREIRLRGVTFVTGSAELTPASRTTLDRIAAILAGAAGVRAQVQGHTDDQGDAAANLALSRRRAEAVVAYLAGKGIARNRLVPRGFGEAQPIASNATDAGRARNRRVVFRRL